MLAEDRLVHPRKAPRPITVTESGMLTEVIPVHPSKAAWPISVTFSGRTNPPTKRVSFLYFSKPILPISFTVEVGVDAGGVKRAPAGPPPASDSTLHPTKDKGVGSVSSFVSQGFSQYK